MLDSIDNQDAQNTKQFNLSDLMLSKMVNLKELEDKSSENIDSSAQVTENGHDSVVILDVQKLQSQFVSNAVSDDRQGHPSKYLQ